MQTVTLLVTRNGTPVSVFATPAQAQERADRYNVDPYIDSETPDPDAPYSVQTWGVQE